MDHQNHKRIYGKVKVHFGNLWAFSSMLILKSRDIGAPVYVSSRMKRKHLVQEMLSHMDTSGSKIIWVDEKYSEGQRKYGVRNHKRPFVNTKVGWTWMHGKYGRICYQLNTKSNNPRFSSKKISDDEIKRILDYLAKDYELIEVGLPYTIQQSINIMSSSDAFIGICSGMSQVAHSVGVPMYLYDWRLLKKCHPKKTYKIFKDSSDFMRKF